MEDLAMLRTAAADLGIGFTMANITSAKEACDLVYSLLNEQVPRDKKHLKLLLEASHIAYVVDVHNALPPDRERVLFNLLIKYRGRR